MEQSPTLGLASIDVKDCLFPPVFQRIAEVAGRRPGALAVSDGRVRWDYGMLLSRSLDYAADVRDAVGPREGPSVVGITLPPSAEHVAAMLGILASGRAWVSLDPSLPPAQFALRTRTAEVDFYLDDVARIRGSAPRPSSGTVPGLDAPASIFFTSGSTGTPKAVVHTHRSILADTERQIDEMAVSPDDRLDLLFALTFSAALSPIFTALLAGASIAMRDLRNLGTVGLEEWFADEGVTISTMGASTFRRFARGVSDPRNLRAIRLLCLGAEPVLRPDAESFQQLYPTTARLQNSLATTETRTLCTFYFGARDPLPTGAVLPLGKAVREKAVFLRDPLTGQILTHGAGEICVRSAIISPGTWPIDRERLDEETEENSRFHATGDLGQWDDSGNLHFLGRIADGFKVAGFRIDPLEIESALRSHSQIDEAIAHPLPAGGGDHRLAVTYASAESISTEDLCRFLAERLPAYLVPTIFRRIEQMPRTSSGKLHRAAVAELVMASEPVGSPSAAPRTVREDDLLTLWREALGQPGIGLDHDFFQCGGDSLSAVALLQAVSEMFGPGTTTDDLREAPSAGAFGQRFLERGTAQSTAVIPLRAGFARNLFCLPGRVGGLIHYTALVPRLAGDLAVYGVRLPRTAELRLPPTALATLAVECADAVQAIQPSGPYALLGFSQGGRLASEVACELEIRGATTDVLVVIDAHNPRAPARQRSLRRVGQRLNAAVHRGLGALLPDRNPEAAVLVDNRLRVDDPIFFTHCDTPIRPHRQWIDLLAAEPQVAAGARADGPLGWRRIARRGLTVHPVPGDHHTLLAAPTVDTVARVINQLLAKRLAAVGSA